MAYLRDGDHCCNLPHSTGIPLTAIGWLDPDHDYPRGKVSEGFFRQLCMHLGKPWQAPFAWAGFHHCELCQFSTSQSHFGGYSFQSTSSSEIFVPNGREIFVSPKNIAHYIDAHGYLPPDSFIDALGACPTQGSNAYLKLLLDSGGREWLKRLEAPEPS
ncbi:hypothetical protein [Luteolibacter luteus]|uniref:DUF7919 domain-containing protein n=1 Tax=Luteolibacter luteus TaxID=2728835 RepID=A0A858RC67_9BACT|nr:hypothetical protein [Luteolibacter luteus]QJE94616.1 hypothetical protein HHL09_02065 [Luteolibacter luteus]